MNDVRKNGETIEVGELDSLRVKIDEIYSNFEIRGQWKSLLKKLLKQHKQIQKSKTKFWDDEANKLPNAKPINFFANPLLQR